MRKKLLYKCAFGLMLCSFSLQAQTQIGSSIYGKASDQNFGTTVALSSNGSIMAVGAPENDDAFANAGQVIIYKNDGGTWKTSGTINGKVNYEKSGSSVAISDDGNTVAIGAPNNNKLGVSTGAVRIFQNISGTWTQIGSDIYGMASTDNAGYSVDISADGSTVIIGSKNHMVGGSPAGQARVFKNNNGQWIQVGSDINADKSNDACGHAVAISADGNIVAVSSPFATGAVSQAGKVKVLKNINGTWTKLGKDIEGEYMDYMSGYSISLSADGTTIAIGDPRNDEPNFNAGHVRVYKYNSNVDEWAKTATFEGDYATDALGTSVSLSADGTVLAMSSIANDGTDSSYENIGMIRLFTNIGGKWFPVGYDLYGDNTDDRIGTCISLSPNGRKLAISTPYSQMSGPFSGEARVYDFSELLSSDQFVMEQTSVYPNPVKNELFVQLNKDLNLKEVNIYSVLGQLIRSEKSNQINVSSLAKGFYLVELVTDKGKATKKVLVD